MSLPSTSKYIDQRKKEIELLIALRRLFKPELRRLRSLPNPNLDKHWYRDDLSLTYRAKLLNMRDAARWLEKWLLLVPGESISSTDDEREGTRTFTASLKKGGHTLFLILVIEVFTEDEDPRATCRKVQVGTHTHTYTSTVPKYALVCD